MSDIEDKQQEMIKLLEKLVNIDSGSNFKVGVDKVGSILRAEYEEIGFTCEIIQEEKVGNHLMLQHNTVDKPSILLIAHMDTVFKEGTADERPFYIKDNRAYGPGVADMKGSQVTLLYAMKYLLENSPESLEKVMILLNSDEEIGSPTSRKVIEKLSVKVEYALVMEPARKDGSIVTSRRGGGTYKLRITGKSAHSGVAPQDGHSAIEEMGHKIVRLSELTNHDEGVSINVGKVNGGEATNVVPDEATLHVDVRVSNVEQSEYIEQQIEDICATPDIQGTKIELTGGIRRPPMELDQENMELLNIIQDVGESLDIEVSHTHTGGGSDASFPSHLGVATVDGLGPVGGEMHSEKEYLEIDSITERTVLLAETIHNLTSNTH
ncbi:M20 family metallopeptidase [Jeotgalicoccus sp. WY2]|uniref:M20 family metallopeptidase n=1 Tax=Jeotgalicoccus sp. WY2 TaxID=2708346 RepID=UPI0020228BDD|nr:M20 family metallopeptidase [Jeotgalicoccus sp. WY2]